MGQVFINLYSCRPSEQRAVDGGKAITVHVMNVSYRCIIHARNYEHEGQED